MPWPLLTDFSEAIQNPHLCFKGTDLEPGKVAEDGHGRPLVYSGNFACVYKVSIGDHNFAVRCFTREVKDQHSRYSQLSAHLNGVILQAFVGFSYLEHGVSVKGDWYPIIKMDWVEGQTLGKFVEFHRDAPETLKSMAAQWRGTTANLHGLYIAHNDLQHGNVMVQGDGNIRLVDYDGIFLPQFRGDPSPELGHRNYQHPQRSAEDYDDYIDNFPSLVIYLSLLAVAADPDLWPEFYNDDNLLFTRNDYADPGRSEIFNRLRNSPDPIVAKLAGYLEECCSRPVEQVPDLETILQDGLPTPAAPPPPATSPPTTPSAYLELLWEQQVVVPAPAAIDQQDFIRFCRSLDGTRLTTLSQGAGFRVKFGPPNIYFIPESNGVARLCPELDLHLFLDYFDKNRSWRTQDYPSDVTTNSSYLLAVLQEYLDNLSQSGPSTTSPAPAQPTTPPAAGPAPAQPTTPSTPPVTGPTPAQPTTPPATQPAGFLNKHKKLIFGLVASVLVALLGIVVAGSIPTPTPVPPARPTPPPAAVDPADAGQSRSPILVGVPVPTAMPTTTPVPTFAPAATPAPTATLIPTLAPTATPMPTPAPTATPIPTPAPTATPTPEPTPMPARLPTATPIPTPVPRSLPDWWHYSNDKYGYMVPVPPNWTVDAGDVGAVRITNPRGQASVSIIAHERAYPSFGAFADDIVNTRRAELGTRVELRERWPVKGDPSQGHITYCVKDSSDDYVSVVKGILIIKGGYGLELVGQMSLKGPRCLGDSVDFDKGIVSALSHFSSW